MFMRSNLGMFERIKTEHWWGEEKYSEKFFYIRSKGDLGNYSQQHTSYEKLTNRLAIS